MPLADEPIILNRYNKVAYDLREDAQVVCKVQAYPRPEFQWSYGTNQAALLTSSEGHYEIGTSSEGNDIYTSTLKVSPLALPCLWELGPAGSALRARSPL